MRLFCRNINKSFDTLSLFLSTDEILMLVKEFEKLVQDENYKIYFQIEDTGDKEIKNIGFRIYDKEKLTQYDELTKRIILEEI